MVEYNWRRGKGRMGIKLMRLFVVYRKMKHAKGENQRISLLVHSYEKSVVVVVVL